MVMKSLLLGRIVLAFAYPAFEDAGGFEVCDEVVEAHSFQMDGDRIAVQGF